MFEFIFFSSVKLSSSTFFGKKITLGFCSHHSRTTKKNRKVQFFNPVENPLKTTNMSPSSSLDVHNALIPYVVEQIRFGAQVSYDAQVSFVRPVSYVRPVSLSTPEPGRKAAGSGERVSAEAA
jgi:hypothetical protein